MIHYVRSWAYAGVARSLPRRLRDRLRPIVNLSPWAGIVLLARWLSGAAFRAPRRLPDRHRLLFVCHGNIIRSPVAEALCRLEAARLGAAVEVASAGLHARAGYGPDVRAVAAAASLGVSLERHVAAPLTAAQVAAADLILVMDYENDAELIARFPSAWGRTTLLGTFRAHPGEIIDPYARGAEAVQAVVGEIRDAVPALVRRMTPHRPRAVRDRGEAWADLSHDEVLRLTDEARRTGWRSAVRDRASVAPFFVQRMENTGIANWHLLAAHPPASRVLDVGCGFGSLLLGLGRHFHTAVGVEFLPERIRMAALRSRQDGLPNVMHARASGFQLPFGPGTFDVVLMNGVLEWAGLYLDGEPRHLQRQMLAEARRVLAPGGTIAVAIENRFALESLLGFRDTHTGLPYVTALPRRLADRLSRARRGEPYRTWLYSDGGYRQLFAQAGLDGAQVLDLLPSYNDYDVVVRPGDGPTYRLLRRLGLARGFYHRADRVRSLFSSAWPGPLGAVAYAYLVLAGDGAMTVLDAGHPLWQALAPMGVLPGAHRFACQGDGDARIAVVTHTGDRLEGLVELGARRDDDRPGLPERVLAGLGGSWEGVGALEWQGIGVRCFRKAPATRGRGQGM